MLDCGQCRESGDELQLVALGGEIKMGKMTPEIIRAAIEGFETQKRRIDDQIVELRRMLNGSGSVQDSTGTKKGTMSAAGRKAIAAAQRKRWALARGEKQAAVAKPKRKLSKAGRAAIVAALKKRWAEKKAAA